MYGLDLVVLVLEPGDQHRGQRHLELVAIIHTTDTLELFLLQEQLLYHSGRLSLGNMRKMYYAFQDNSHGCRFVSSGVQVGSWTGISASTVAPPTAVLL